MSLMLHVSTQILVNIETIYLYISKYDIKNLKKNYPLSMETDEKKKKFNINKSKYIRVKFR